MIAERQFAGLSLTRLSRFVRLAFAIALERGDIFKRRAKLEETLRADFGLVLSAILTLLGLIIGFSFSMSISRYDQRKNYEEAEANAIGTEYLRVDLLPAADAARLRTLLENYLDQRILSYETRDKRQLSQIDAQTAQLQTESVVRRTHFGRGAGQSGLVALAVAGMNDVLNAQGYTQAAWRNRIPMPAWVLMATIAVCGNILVGFGAQQFGYEAAFLLILPLALSISFFLIADIDSPRGGVIRVNPENLISLADSLRAQTAKP